jgi:23S rRNA pseudouridine2605 synthase
MASTTAAVIDKKDQASKRKPSQAIVSRQSTLRKKFYAIPNPDSKGPKKLIVNRPPLFRADRVLSNRGFGSRSECFDLLKGRRVAVWANEKWNNILGPSQRIHTESRIMVDGKEVPRTPLLLLFHKPKWVLSVMRDPKDRPNLSQLLPEKYVRQGLHPVGRLDYDSSGLLLFSSSGPLTQRLLHPSHEISKEYVATVEGLVNPEELHSLLEGGVETAEGVHTANLVNVKHLKPHDAKAILKHMRDNLPKEYNTDDLEERGYLKKDIMEMSEVSLVVSEGKHRMVRRMLANCGHPVVELKREKHGEVRLGDLPEGEFRDLTEEELEWVMTVMPPRSKKGKNRKSE